MLESALLLCMLVVVDKPNRETAAAPDWAPSVVVVTLKKTKKHSKTSATILFVISFSVKDSA